VHFAPGVFESVEHPPQAFVPSQALLTQHPNEQDFESQTHAPLELHSCPLLQALQDAPFVPHVEKPDVSHSPLLLQHPEHEVPSHTHFPPVQRWPWSHAPHLAPPVPHSLSDSLAYGVQDVPSQHPPAHDLASHTHLPAVHS
jgi:hypothetical protein